ncbi:MULTISPECIES: CocE/NonD family hydrolase [unclassified Streptomyces]|uniref:CocE/NonD family hydrolase n=1 Tax=unclassified Streptomyces TaxID=2593676 RepID=UPI002472F97C|nr:MULTISPECIES: CocE/NonD family hydrolase [unclassified Streptomyces]MDH6455316.1 putative acyl esterase [Streptomyces sp. SAI-119]MDH6494131.1 putative acyl esterase [Streptomyces sp. SAI-149]
MEAVPDQDFFTPAKPPQAGGYPGFRPAAWVEDGMRCERDVAVEMRDGTVLYVDVYRPEGGADVPVLLAYGPYGKHNGFPPILAAGADIEPPLPEGTRFEAPVASYWVGHGYAVVYADPRGTWWSEGDATYLSPQEAEDGHDLVEWAGTQPWSNGKVGMSGVSYLAMTQYTVAATLPPHLAAINPSEGISDVYRESMFQGGILETQFSGHLTGELTGYGRGRIEDVFSGLLAHPLLDEYWASRAFQLEKIEVPAFFVCSTGNHGTHTRGTLEAYRRTGSAQKWLDVHGRKEWRYYYTPRNVERQRTFFDHFLKGIDNDLSSWPPVRVEYRDRAETGPVRAETVWPPAGVRHRPYHLDALTGRLLPATPSRAATTGYDPTKSPTEPYRHAGDQRSVFDLTFDETTDLAGPVSLTLWAESPGAADMDVFVTLDKIDTDGNRVCYPLVAYLDDGPLAYGWMRASRRELDPDLSTPERPVQAHRRDLPLPENGPVRLDIEIWPITAHFQPGEILRLTIAGADIYRWPAEHLVNGHDFLNNTAEHIFHTGAGHDAVLRLPVITATSPSGGAPQQTGS